MRRSLALLVGGFFIFSNLVWAAEVRKLGISDMLLGPSNSTWTSPAGKSVRYFPYPYAGDGINDNAAVVDVRAFGSALTDVPIQAAIDSLDNTTGGTIYIPAGTYVLTKNLLFLNKNNVRIIGAGMGKTVIDGRSVSDHDYGYTEGYLPDYPGLFSFSAYPHDDHADPPTSQYLSNIEISGITIQGTVTTGASGGTWRQLFFYNAKNVYIDKVEIVGCVETPIYFVGYGSNIHVTNSKFRDSTEDTIQQTGAIDFNSLNYDGIYIDSNYFDNVTFAIAALGTNIHVTNNSFKNIKRKGMEIGESGGTTRRSIGSSVISGNTFAGLGTNASIASGSYGILVSTVGYQYTDNTTDRMPIISNNSFIDSIATASVIMIDAYGPALIANNYASGIYSGSDADTYFIRSEPNVDNGMKNIFIQNNVMEKYPNAIAYGITVTRQDNVAVFMSNNYIDAGTASLLTSGASTCPYFSFSGDILNYQWNNCTPLSTYNGDRAFDNVALYGDTNNGVRTSGTIALYEKTFPTGAGVTTPSIKGGNLWRFDGTDTTTITNFTDGVAGKEITIVFIDAVITIANGTNIRLNGHANVTPTAYSTMTFIHNGTNWYEKSRSIY